jgi:hypothetical protein
MNFNMLLRSAPSIAAKLGIKVKGRNVVENNEAYELREPSIPYG